MTRALFLVAAFGVLGTSCTHVQSWERVKLDDPSMAASLSGPAESRMYGVHEGAAGGAFATAREAPSARARTIRVGSDVVVEAPVHARRVITSRVNLLQPMELEPTPSGVAITFARRGRHGETVTVDARSLAPLGSHEYVYPEEATAREPAFLVPESVRLALESGLTLLCWTDEATGRVMMRTVREDGEPASGVVLVSPPDAIVVGAPRAVTYDGRHVVVAFFTSSDDGFDLVATSLGAP